MVHVSLDTPYMVLLKDYLATKHKLAIDSWGGDDTHVKHIYMPLVHLIEENVTNKKHLEMYPFPVWTLKKRVERMSRAILLGEVFALEWAEHFRGKTFEELDELAQSFKFDNCLKRDGLNKVLTEHAEVVKNL